MPPDFTVTDDELVLIAKIAVRAAELGLIRQDYSRSTLVMDLCACNANGCPLELERMAQGEAFDLAHDVIGIANHIDRKTGKLEGCFLPRYAKPERA